MFSCSKIQATAAFSTFLFCGLVTAEKPLDQVIEEKVKSTEAKIKQKVNTVVNQIDNQVEKSESASKDSQCQSVSTKVITGSNAQDVTQTQSGSCNSQSLVVGGQKK